MNWSSLYNVNLEQKAGEQRYLPTKISSPLLDSLTNNALQPYDWTHVFATFWASIHFVTVSVIKEEKRKLHQLLLIVIS